MTATKKAAKKTTADKGPAKDEKKNSPPAGDTNGTSGSDAPAKAKKTKGGDGMADPYSTSPSNDKTRDPDIKTATEPNSKQRIARKVSRTGRNNGGDENRGRRPGLNTDLTADRLGEREAVSPGETDAIWTNESKDRWGAGQPSTADLLKQRDEIARQKAKREE